MVITSLFSSSFQVLRLFFLLLIEYQPSDRLHSNFLRYSFSSIWQSSKWINTLITQKQIKSEEKHPDSDLLCIYLFSIFVTPFKIHFQFISILPYSLLLRFEYISVVVLLLPQNRKRLLSFFPLMKLKSSWLHEKTF